MAVVSASTACRSSISRRAGTSCASRVRSAVPHTRARHAADTHTEARARAGSRHTHSRRAFGSSLPHTGRTYPRKPLAARASHTLGTPSAAASHTSRLCPAASHTRARALSLATDGAAGGRSQRVAACRRTEWCEKQARARARTRTYLHAPPAIAPELLPGAP